MSKYDLSAAIVLIDAEILVHSFSSAPQLSEETGRDAISFIEFSITT